MDCKVCVNYDNGSCSTNCEEFNVNGKKCKEYDCITNYTSEKVELFVVIDTNTNQYFNSNDDSSEGIAADFYTSIIDAQMFESIESAQEYIDEELESEWYEDSENVKPNMIIKKLHMFV